MSTKSNDSSDPYAIVLADLEAKKTQFLAEVDAAIAAIKRVRDLGGATQLQNSVSGAPKLTNASLPSVAAKATDDPFIGMALPEAAAKQLELANEPQTPREIWAALECAGYKSTSEDPVHGVQWALNRRAKKVGDVVLIGYGKWALKSRYTEDELEMLGRSRGGMAGRDRGVHIAKTKNAIAALKSRGVHWGRPITTTAEQWCTFLRARASGATVKAAASVAGFSPAVVMNFEKNYAIDQWKPGDPWPPTHLKLSKDERLPSKIRLVK